MLPSKKKAWQMSHNNIYTTISIFSQMHGEIFFSENIDLSVWLICMGKHNVLKRRWQLLYRLKTSAKRARNWNAFFSFHIAVHRVACKVHKHWRQTGRKSGGAEWDFETYLVKFETYSVLRDYETKKTTGAPAPAAPASLAPMNIITLIIVA